MENTQAQKTWNQIISQILTDMGKFQFDRWILPAVPVDLTQDDNSATLTIATPDELTRAWLESRITSTAQRLAIGILNKPNVEIKFIVKDPTP